MSAVSVDLPPDVLEQIAQRVAELLAERGDLTAGRVLDANGDGDGGWLRGAAAIASYLSCPRSRVYALAACQPPRIPVERDGSALVAQRGDLDRWLRSGGGRRP